MFCIIAVVCECYEKFKTSFPLHTYLISMRKWYIVLSPMFAISINVRLILD